MRIKPGGRVLAIPHNGNLSNGLMFDDVTFAGRKLTRAYAEQRTRWEPVYEVTQMKGDGEAHPFLSPNDEFADYGTWDKGSFGPEPKTPEMLPREYAREALKRGLEYDARLGANPFKFGMIGSTDSHTSLATAEEDNYFGKATPAEPSADRRAVPGADHRLSSGSGRPGHHHPPLPDARFRARSGLGDGQHPGSAVGCPESQRGVRHHGHAHGGAGLRRLGLRGGRGAAPGLRQRGLPARRADGRGDLQCNAPDGKAPTFLIRALRDVDGANLDRIQIVKGWLDRKNEPHEQVYDVLCSDDRKISVEHRCEKPVGNTVDVPTATYVNSIGDALMLAYWKDPDFDPNQRAFYYVRVLEIPTPRWTTYDAAFFGVELPEGDRANPAGTGLHVSDLVHTLRAARR